jgi:hypothetical protein
VVLPGPFLEEAVAGFSSNCAEYSRCLEEVEQVRASHACAFVLVVWLYLASARQPSGRPVGTLPLVIWEWTSSMAATLARNTCHLLIGRWGLSGLAEVDCLCAVVWCVWCLDAGRVQQVGAGRSS